jgi:hypothetical protein
VREIMGGRKVCFIDADGQVGTCIRDDEDCYRCDTQQDHLKWQKSEHEMSSDYYDKIFEKLVTIEKLTCDIRGVSIVVHNFGYLELHAYLDLKLNYIQQLIRDIEKLSIEQMRKQAEEAGYDTQRIKLALERMS